ncbi:uncharacterized protein CXorf65 homolog [Mercenaria mercenaria]|uniref:uncharacterized protein CXorf65 homolog n=1 Tax=Mercenaria mercenaria TaxID=6596 RepID=UPI00234FAD13|nr:uncharacterized protein CXorf65 homolog [Mercenaria mercenaria]
MTTFVTIQYGENEELIINPNCRQQIFMEYLRKKCQYDKRAFIDLLDENGKLALVHLVAPHDNVRECFEDRLIYIPVMLEKIPDSDNYKTVKPQLEDWEKTYPQLERKIKILTGELRRKKSPYRGLDPRGRTVDRKASSLNKSDAGRSQSHLGRQSSILQSGRLSTTNARKSILGNKADAKSAAKAKGAKGKKK